MVEVWLTQAEGQDAALQEQLRPLYGAWAGMKYTVAVFHSGDQSLYQQTQALLSYNKKRIAALEVQREKAACAAKN
jgi:hypothetical protein